MNRKMRCFVRRTKNKKNDKKQFDLLCFNLM